MNIPRFQKAIQDPDTLIFDAQGRRADYSDLSYLFEPLVRMQFIELGRNTFQLKAAAINANLEEIQYPQFVVVLPLHYQVENSVVDLKIPSPQAKKNEHRAILKFA